MSRVLARLCAVAIAACLLFTTWSAATPKQASALDPTVGYLMAHFTGESSTDQQIYLAHSTDGLRWTDLNNGGLVLRSTIGTRESGTPRWSAHPAVTGTGSWPPTCASPAVRTGRARSTTAAGTSSCGVHRPGQLVRAVAVERGRRDPGRTQRLGPGGDLEPGHRRLRPLLGDERPAQRGCQAPHLLRAHDGLP
ncbi:hypothetical protein NKG94_15550 [Micromonospora sp. M12]